MCVYVMYVVAKCAKNPVPLFLRNTSSASTYDSYKLSLLELDPRALPSKYSYQKRFKNLLPANQTTIFVFFSP